METWKDLTLKVLRGSTLFPDSYFSINKTKSVVDNIESINANDFGGTIAKLFSTTHWLTFPKSGGMSQIILVLF